MLYLTRDAAMLCNLMEKKPVGCLGNWVNSVKLKPPLSK